MAQLPDNPQDVEIIIYPHPGLRAVADPVEDPADPKLAELVGRMRHLMKEHGGVGLAATQVNVMARLFLANPTGEPDDELVVINPQIIETEGWQETKEGCLSIPEVVCKLRRHQRVKVRHQTLAGETVETDASDFLACILQHESDHLDGKLIIDRVGMVGKLAIRDQIKKLEREFESAATQ